MPLDWHRSHVMPAQGPPLPTRQIMSQWWRDITFAHWRIDPATLAPLLPIGVRPDVHDDSAWVGLLPFRMVDAGVGRGRPVSYLGTFLETNVRVYSVDDHGRRGVVFLSLEAERLAVVLGANASFRVPYKWAHMTYRREGDVHHYETRRRPGGQRSRMSVEVGAAITEPTALERFLTARFGLHTRALGRTWWVPNSHGPWPLRRARLIDVDDELVTAAGLPDLTASAPDSVLFSEGVRTVFGLPHSL